MRITGTTAAKFFASPGGVLPSIPSINTPLEPQLKAQASPRRLYTPILNCFYATSAYLRVPPEDVKLDGLLRRVMGDAPMATTPCDTFFESPCNAQHFIF